MSTPWPAFGGPTRARSPLSEQSTPSSRHVQLAEGSTSPRSPQSPLRYPSMLSSSAPATSKPPLSSSHSSGSCFVHSHLDQSLTEAIKCDAAAKLAQQKKSRRKNKSRGDRPEEDGDSTASEGALESEDENSLTRQLAETAVSVREMSKQLGASHSCRRSRCLLTRVP